jgi:hypothetical protein
MISVTNLAKYVAVESCIYTFFFLRIKISKVLEGAALTQYDISYKFN